MKEAARKFNKAWPVDMLRQPCNIMGKLSF